MENTIIPKVDHFAFRVSNLDASIEFYRSVLGLKLLSKTVDEEHQEAFAFLELKGGNLELLQLLNEGNQEAQVEKADIKRPYCPHLAIRTEDLDRLALTLEDRNVPIVKGPLEIPDIAKWLYISDPDHNIIEFVQWLKS